MQVQRIQNNNYNINFNAKLTLSGFINDIPYFEIEKLKEKALSIGTTKDRIDFHLSVPKISERYHGRSCKYFISHRDIRVTTNIDNKLVDNNTPIGYSRNYNCNSKSLTIDAINDYLDNFQKNNKGKI